MTDHINCDLDYEFMKERIAALEAQLAALSELFPCGCRKIDMDNSYGDCIFCGFRKGYEEYEKENEELEAKLSDSDDAIEHLRVSEAEREETEEKLRKELASALAYIASLPCEDPHSSLGNCPHFETHRRDEKHYDYCYDDNVPCENKRGKCRPCLARAGKEAASG